MPRSLSTRRRWLTTSLCLGAAPALVAASLAFGYDPVEGEARAPLQARDHDYIGASTCRSCHLDHFQSWRRTYHSTMTQRPSRESVLGRFDGQAVTTFGVAATPFEHEGRFYFKLPGLGAEPEREAEVALLVGSRRYQQYFERREGSDGVTLRRLPLLWHVAEGRWLHLNGVFLEPDSDVWNSHGAVWNANCIFCHNTGVRPGFTPAPDGSGKRFDSHVSDLGIACESCHGPGREHARRNTSPLERYGAALSSEAADDIVNPRRLGQRESTDLCGQCHAQRLPNPPEKIWTYLNVGPGFRPGDALARHVTPVTRDTPSLDPQDPNLFRDRFWNDGTARLTAYEYLGTTQSPCYESGRFGCTSCHSMHSGEVEGQLEPELRGDRACTQCHAKIGANVAAHTHHAPASSGSRCLDCHMPRMVYGVLTIHRSHRIESPDALRDIEADRPNACTLCHVDRNAVWAADAMRQFWGNRYERPRSRFNGAPLELPDALVWLHAGDPLERAVAVSALGRPGLAVPARERAFVLGNALVGLGDAYGAIRQLARASALELDARLGLGLDAELRAFDVQAPRAERDRALKSLLDRFAAGARGKFGPPPPDTLLGGDYGFELGRLRALLGLQSARGISIGE